MTDIEQQPTQMTHRQILVVLTGLMLGLFLAALDQTIVATALPTIVGEFGGLDHLSWVVTAYLLASTVTVTPVRKDLRPLRPQGRLPDGHRPLPDRVGPLRPLAEHGSADLLPSRSRGWAPAV